MALEKVRFTLLFRGDSYNVVLPSLMRVSEAMEYLEHQIGIPVSTQKLIISHGSSRSTQAPVIKAGLPVTNQTLSEAGIGDGSKLLLIGTPLDEVEFVRNARSDVLMMGFEEEERREKLRRTYKPTNSTSVQPRIGSIEVLQQFATPAPYEALALIRRIANDPGVVAIMEKYDWKVGVLKEMPPEGMVGVDPVCVLGYNRNMGMEIVLRLRTDDLNGFRKYDIIRTMLHELCHNRHSDHDGKFWALYRQLEKDYATLNWQVSGHTLATGDTAPMREPDAALPSEGYVLGHAGSNHRNHDHSQHSHHNNHHPLLHSPEEHELSRQRAADLAQQRLRQTLPPSNPPIVPSHVTRAVPKVSTSKPVENSGDALPDWRCATCTFDNRTHRLVCEMCGTQRYESDPTSFSTPSVAISPAGLNPAKGENDSMDIVHAEADEISVINGPVEQLKRSIEHSIDALIMSIPMGQRDAALRVIQTVLSNIRQHPEERKYREVRLSALQKKVSVDSSLLNFMKAMGFTLVEGQNLLQLVRQDDVLLYIADSVVQSRLGS